MSLIAKQEEEWDPVKTGEIMSPIWSTILVVVLFLEVLQVPNWVLFKQRTNHRLVPTPSGTRYVRKSQGPRKVWPETKENKKS